MNQNPYSAPTENSSEQLPPKTARNRGGYQYIPLTTLAKILLISVGVVCCGLVVISTMEVIGQMLFPNFSDPNAPLSSDSEQYFVFAIAGIGALTSLTFLLAAVVTAIYFYRANANSRATAHTRIVWSLLVHPNHKFDQTLSRGRRDQHLQPITQTPNTKLIGGPLVDVLDRR